MKRLLLLLLLLLGLPLAADAQVAPQAIVGYLGPCATGPSPCFIQYGAQIPIGPPAGSSATTVATITITAGNTFQNVLAASTTRKSLSVENNNTNGDNCWIFPGAFGTATKATAILLMPGGSVVYASGTVPSDIISATCATTADTLYVANQ